MAGPLPDLSRCRILLSNDDGIHAPGFAALERIARSLSDDVWVCAPESEQSATSHSLTIHRPLRLRQHGERRFAVDGTPTDCVLLAINHILKDRKPDLVLSGVNAGANIGDDVTYSGTIAAAMEATLLGVRAIALSQDYDRAAGPADFAPAERWAPDVVRRAAAVEWPANTLVNVNFPAGPAESVGPVQVVRHAKHKLDDEVEMRTDPRGRQYFWIGPVRSLDDVAEDTDIAVVKSGGIAVTPLYLDLTHHGMVQSLRQALA
ncbi:MAG TPA: 5'/3'-nucleotidase SurE [Alphaproteobacteria bacterium]|nr:5'/3'-nucleotidase SurE [Alphaproteobacteria bacterium]